MQMRPQKIYPDLTSTIQHVACTVLNVQSCISFKKTKVSTYDSFRCHLRLHFHFYPHKLGSYNKTFTLEFSNHKSRKITDM